MASAKTLSLLHHDPAEKGNDHALPQRFPRSGATACRAGRGELFAVDPSRPDRNVAAIRCARKMAAIDSAARARLRSDDRSAA